MDIATRQWRFEIGVFLLLDGLPSMANEPHLPGKSTNELKSKLEMLLLKITVILNILPFKLEFC